MKEVVIGFLGCGNVGGGVWKLLENFRREIAHRNELSVRVKKILVRDVNKARSCTVPQELYQIPRVKLHPLRAEPQVYRARLHRGSELQVRVRGRAGDIPLRAAGQGPRRQRELHPYTKA